MKRIIIALFLAVLPLSSQAHAEQEDFNIEGEWYISAPTYCQTDYLTEKDADGNYHITADWGSVLLCEDGNAIVKDRDGKVTESEQVETAQISDDSFFAFSEGSDGFGGYQLTGDLIVESDGEYSYYTLELENQVLFFDGNLIPNANSKEGEESIRYMLSGDELYLIQGNEYLSGKVISHGEDIFFYELDSAEEESFDYAQGELLMIFIRTSALE